VHFEAHPNDSIRRAAQTLNMSYGNVRNILKYFLKMHPYKVQCLQFLSDNAKLARKSFCQNLCSKISNNEIDIDAEKIIFSDEAHFWLNGYVNKQNYRFWGTQPSHIIEEHNLHPKKITAWIAITNRQIYITVFTNTVTGESYNKLLKNRFFPWLRRNGYDSTYWFMQDGATSHRTKQVFETLYSKFGPQVIGLGYEKFANGGMAWPPYSSDLNPCDFFLWGFLKDRIYSARPTNEAELEKAIKNEVKAINAEMLGRVFLGFQKRLEFCENSNGGHFETIVH